MSNSDPIDFWFSIGIARGELFWGDDRLEDAIRWSKHGTLA
jgi:hypothetical protein